MDATYVKRNCSNSKIIKMGGIVESSYYRVPSDGKKGNKPSKETFYNTKGFVSQDVVITSIKDILKH